MTSAGDTRRPTGDLVPEIPELLVAAVPAPRPEILARVLAGLRDLPDEPVRPGTHRARPDIEGADLAPGALMPLPRRRT